MKKFALIAVLALAGCATDSGVVQMGPDSYMISRQAGSGFSGIGNLKADAVREAGAYCTKKGKVIQVLQTKDSKPPYVLGNFPRTEVDFTCR